MKKNIALVTGGDSSELVISMKSAEQVDRFLDKVKYRTFLVYIRGEDWHVKTGAKEMDKVPIDRADFSFRWQGENIPFDYAFVALHGPPGENGQLQSYLDGLGLPYSTSGARSLELSFNKNACKKHLRKSGILTPESLLLGQEPGEDPEEIIRELGLPCFIKPNAGGSSFGVSRINDASELNASIEKALKEDDEVLIESFIPGRELTCGVLKTRSRDFIFPVTEIISRNEFFDYEAKYTLGMAEEVTPADIPEDLSVKCRELSSRIYDLLDCRGIVRVDFIANENGLYFLELNGVPGMSRESIIPRQIRSLGHTEAEIYNLIIEDTAGWGDRSIM